MSDIPAHASAVGEDGETQVVVSRTVAWSQVITLSLTEITSWGILYYTFSLSSARWNMSCTGTRPA